MIEQYCTGQVINTPSSSMPVAVEQPQAFTINRNSVIILRCSKDEYNLDDMNMLRDYYAKVFPNNSVCVMFDDIEIEIVHDKSWRPSRPCAEESYDTYNYN